MPAIWIPKRLVDIGLINTAAEAAASFSCHCEIEYEARVQAAAKEILVSKAKIVMLTGPSASGKTTTAHKIAAALCAMGHKSEVISLDNFFKNVEDYPRLANGKKDYENVEALDIKEVNECLNDIINKDSADVPEFDFITEHRKDKKNKVEIKGGVAIVEGIHALNPKLIELVPDDKVYKIYAGLREEYAYEGIRFLPTRDIRLARRMVRDYKFRGHSLEKTLSMWTNVCDGEDRYIKVFKPNADLLFDTSFSYEICCLAPFVKTFSNALDKDNLYFQMLTSLVNKFSYCDNIQEGYIPQNSMLREFIGC